MYNNEQKQFIVRGVFLIRSLPIDDNQIVRAAKEMIAEHGHAGIGAVDQRISDRPNRLGNLGSMSMPRLERNAG